MFIDSSEKAKAVYLKLKRRTVYEMDKCRGVSQMSLKVIAFVCFLVTRSLLGRKNQDNS